MKKDTLIVTGGRRPEDHFGVVNPPVYHASTVTYPTLDEWEAAGRDRLNAVVYGRFGTPTSFAFEEAVAKLEGGDRAVSVSSGLGACTATILACVQSGDHILVTDNVYFPVRNLCNSMLKDFGVESTFYDPLIGAGVEALIRPNTKLIYTEAPGSQTFEMQDIPAIAEVARKHGIRTAMDNTWATPLLFRPLDHGIDYSINAATKYIVGHSDAMLGVVSMRADLFERLKTVANYLGCCPGADEIYLGLRGLRTMSVRLARHGENALRMAQWFQQRPEVDRVLYPALPDDPGHGIWKRDFAGASGLFTVILKPAERSSVAAMVDGLNLFGLGASFGGYESLVLPVDPSKYRTATTWDVPGPALRFHIGLEDPADLIADLEKGFGRLGSTT